MEMLLDKFKREQGGLRRTRSVRASLRLIGNRWRSAKDGEQSEDIETKRDIVFSKHIWCDADNSIAYTGLEGTYRSKTPIMAKRKPELAKQRRKSGNIDLTMKPQQHRKVEKAKFSDIFLNKKQKSVSAKELLPPQKVPPKAAAILHIHSPIKDKTKKKLKIVGKSESAKSMTEASVPQRTRRGSESELSVTQSHGCVNHAFVYSTPPKERKLALTPHSPSYLSTYLH
ncbi:hypothetical protein RR48_07911 [Papilio machaon]|uniref:Uncharacterized protein n=1 Tax=Papilio machaon TaxID=76193 RepID=A0A194QZ28_PAPMA|nr:hypothetical protein RR48_07911 [Papilio machaon]